MSVSLLVPTQGYYEINVLSDIRLSGWGYNVRDYGSKDLTDFISGSHQLSIQVPVCRLVPTTGVRGWSVRNTTGFLKLTVEDLEDGGLNVEGLTVLLHSSYDLLGLLSDPSPS